MFSRQSKQVGLHRIRQAPFRVWVQRLESRGSRRGPLPDLVRLDSPGLAVPADSSEALDPLPRRHSDSPPRVRSQGLFRAWLLHGYCQPSERRPGRAVQLSSVCSSLTFGGSPCSDSLTGTHGCPGFGGRHPYGIYFGAAIWPFRPKKRPRAQNGRGGPKNRDFPDPP